MDYCTLRGLVQHLAHLSWLAVEDIAPGIDTLNLPTDVATEWKSTASRGMTAASKMVGDGS